jgi:hypothetical protein
MPHKQTQAPSRPPAPPPEDPPKEETLKEREAEEQRRAILRPGRIDPGAERARGKATRGHDEIATRKHLEGSEQGPQ